LFGNREFGGRCHAGGIPRGRGESMHRRGGRGGAGHGGHGLRMRRQFAAGDLQLIILALLEQQPELHGYEIIKAIEERSNGAYIPSPGMVYPALTYLEEIGYASVQSDGTRRRYRLTEAGQAQLALQRDRAHALLMALSQIGERIERARQAFDHGAEDAAATLDAARRELRAALFETIDAGEAEQARVAEILRRTIAEIRRR
jgi:DNA-binding PadR family transcriptional regulator